MNLKKPRVLALLSLLLALSACAPASQNSTSTLVLYSGRSEELIAPFIEVFTQESGIKVEARYGDSAALAAQILEEAGNSPADVFLSQDAGALGAVADSDLLAQLDSKVIAGTSKEFVSKQSDWIGITGRVRVLAYSPERVKSLPNSIADLVDPQWKNRLGIAPTNSSFQTFITAMIQSQGEAATEAWLTDLMKIQPKFYEKNSLIVAAIDSGEIDAGLVNHYYLWEVAEELGREIAVRNHFFAAGDIGNLINVSGAGILKSAKNVDAAQQFIQFLLSPDMQDKFVAQTHEFSLTRPEPTPEGLPKLSEIGAPQVDLSELADLKRTQNLLLKVGML